jgi:hypothetical protein
VSQNVERRDDVVEIVCCPNNGVLCCVVRLTSKYFSALGRSSATFNFASSFTPGEVYIADILGHVCGDFSAKAKANSLSVTCSGFSENGRSHRGGKSRSNLFCFCNGCEYLH